MTPETPPAPDRPAASDGGTLTFLADWTTEVKMQRYPTPVPAAYQPPQPHPMTTLIEKLLQEHRIAHEAFTATQMAEAIRQALACGDFIRCVALGDPNKSQVIYVPFAECLRYQLRITELERLLTQHGIQLPPQERSVDE